MFRWGPAAQVVSAAITKGISLMPVNTGPTSPFLPAGLRRSGRPPVNVGGHLLSPPRRLRESFRQHLALRGVGGVCRSGHTLFIRGDHVGIVGDGCGSSCITCSGTGRTPDPLAGGGRRLISNGTERVLGSKRQASWSIRAKVSVIPECCLYERTGFHLGNIGFNLRLSALRRVAGL